MKESDDETVPLPVRPISPHRNFVTARGMAAIEANLNRFEAAYRSAIAKEDKQAVAAALREVRYWSARRSNAEAVKPPSAVSRPSRLSERMRPIHRVEPYPMYPHWPGQPSGAQ